jgi:colanic acid biosynthesis glycosyl transferase WcaI
VTKDRTRLRLAVVCPHFAPDTAPTGDVMTGIVHGLAARGHQLDVVTSLPWYREHAVEPEWRGRLVRAESTPWGRIRRIYPFPTNKHSIVQRAAGFAGFSGLATVTGMTGSRVDGVIAMSPPLTLGLVGKAMAVARRAPLVFNVQDIFPDVAIALGAITDERLITVARRLERMSYAVADAVTVLSEDLRENVVEKVKPDQRSKVRVIPNFVDTKAIHPTDRLTPYRRELGITHETVVLYAGNVGLSQSLDLVVEAARQMLHRNDVVFVVNGGGSALADLQGSAAGLSNLRFAPYQPKDRLNEVLATGDIHLVPLRRGLARSSVPSKTYSILAAGRPVLASVDAGTEVTRIIDQAGAGVAVPPDDPDAFIAALGRLVDDHALARAMGERGRRWVEHWASPDAVAAAYEGLIAELRRPVGERNSL